MITCTRDEGTIIELLSFRLHDVDELITGEALRIRRLLIALVDLVGS